MLFEIFEGPSTAPVGMTFVRASYTITNTLRDAPHEQAYREEVRLVGDDRGEGGTAELLPIDAIWDGVVGVTTSQVQFVRSPEKLYPQQRSGRRSKSDRRRRDPGRGDLDSDSTNTGDQGEQPRTTWRTHYRSWDAR